jgi:hypothetical protein
MPRSPSGIAGPIQLDKAINTLLGLVEGVAVDGVCTPAELAGVDAWLAAQAAVGKLHPFCEFAPLLRQMLAEGRLEFEARSDLLWLCDSLRSERFFDRVTADIQRMQGVAGGLIADGRIDEAELAGLREWLRAHAHLHRCWPYEEVDALIERVLADGRIDDEERAELNLFLTELLTTVRTKAMDRPTLEARGQVEEVFATEPKIVFQAARFCFTGAAAGFQRADAEALVCRLGGRIGAVDRDLDWLVLGGRGNPAWAYAAYGRKVEKAMELKKAGRPLSIVREADFLAAVAQQGGAP